MFLPSLTAPKSLGARRWSGSFTQERAQDDTAFRSWSKELFSMKRIILLCVLASASLLAQTAPSAKPQSADPQQQIKRTEIRQLIQLTGAAKIAGAVMKQMIEPLKAANPQVPAEFWDEFMRQVDPEELIDLIVPIYDKYYTLEEIRELVRFYQSPAGQKTIKVLPQLSAESIHAGQQWGQEIGERVMRKMKEKGYDRS
jgi:hypothetical protein